MRHSERLFSSADHSRDEVLFAEYFIEDGTDAVHLMVVIVIQKLPVVESNSCSSFKRGYIMAHHLSCEAFFRVYRIARKHSFIIGCLRLSL